MRFIVFLLAVFMSMPALSLSVQAADIQEFTTPKGIKVWLVESPSLPIISAQVSFAGGSAYDTVDKLGLAQFSAGLLDEGAGDMDASAFALAMEEKGIGLGAGVDTLNFKVNLKTLAEHKQSAFDLLGLMLTKPQLTKDSAERVRAAQLSGIKRGQEKPDYVASRKLSELVFGNHPYARPSAGELWTVENLTARDARRFLNTTLTRNNMQVSVVGQTTPADIAPLIDKALGDLPKGKARQAIPAPTEQAAAKMHIPRDVPQSTLRLGHLGNERTDELYFPTLLMNHILGGGGFSSRLVEEVREKRGLSYSVYSYFSPLPGKGAFILGAQTEHENTEQVIDLMKAEMVKLQQQEVDDKTYQDAMDYMLGSFPLRLDSNSKILGYLDFMQTENLGIDYLDNWQERMEAVTKADIQAAAKKFLKPDDLKVIIVGQRKPQKQTSAKE